jgi:hypothetical protein
MNNRITRKDIVACDWSWCAVNQAKAYRHAVALLNAAGCSGRGTELATSAIRNMMRYHALDAIRLARIYTTSR